MLRSAYLFVNVVTFSCYCKLFLVTFLLDSADICSGTIVWSIKCQRKLPDFCLPIESF